MSIISKKIFLIALTIILSMPSSHSFACINVTKTALPNYIGLELIENSAQRVWFNNYQKNFIIRKNDYNFCNLSQRIAIFNASESEHFELRCSPVKFKFEIDDFYPENKNNNMITMYVAYTKGIDAIIEKITSILKEKNFRKNIISEQSFTHKIGIKNKCLMRNYIKFYNLNFHIDQYDNWEYWGCKKPFYIKNNYQSCRASSVKYANNKFDKDNYIVELYFQIPHDFFKTE